MVEFEYLIDHASHKKGDVIEMPKSTAEALAKHKVGKVGKEIKAKKTKVAGKATVIKKK